MPMRIGVPHLKVSFVESERSPVFVLGPYANYGTFRQQNFGRLVSYPVYPSIPKILIQTTPSLNQNQKPPYRPPMFPLESHLDPAPSVQL